ncbi:MAG: hypothetical protein ACKVU4_12725 [Phycisphaerales bacterium]
MPDELTRTRAVERRIWRLAFLLTADPDRAAALIDDVLDSGPDPATLEPARLDRLIVLRSREGAGAAGAATPTPVAGMSGEAARTLRAALKLPPQPLEAWVLARVDELDDLHVSRAMDCSRTAAGHHLEAADAAMRRSLADGFDAGLAALRAFADALDLGPIIAHHRALARRRRTRGSLIVIGVVGLVVLGVTVAVLRAIVG